MTGAGEERIASLLIKEIAMEYDVSLVLFNGPVDYDLPNNIKITYLKKSSSFFLIRALSLPLVFFKYLRFCKKNEIDISLSFDNVPNYINSLLKIFGWKGKAWIREVNFPSIRYQKGIKALVHRFFIKWCYPKADILFVNALRIGTDLVNNFNAPKELLALFNNPLDIEAIKNQSINSNVQKPNSFTFIHVGAFRTQKNHHLLIESFAKIKHLDVELWLLGKGPLENDIRSQIKELQLSDKIKLLGFHKNPYQFMKKADCMVMSSDFEGLPNVLIEGMACGLPIVSTDCLSGPREVIAPLSDFNVKLSNTIEIGKYGILTPIKDSDQLAKAMDEIVSNKELYESLKVDLDKGIQAYNIPIVVAEFRNNLASVIES